MKLGHHCQVCRSPHVRDINAAIVRGEADTVCARRWQLDPDAVRRHRIKGHLPPVGAQPGLTREPGRPVRLGPPAKVARRLSLLARR